MTVDNLVLLTIDSLRPDHLGCYGYPRPTTPHIDAMAEEGAVCEQAVASGPSTPVSFVSILTSTYPLAYGGYHQLSDNRVTVAELLSQGGFTCAAFHSNPYTSSSHGYERGFAHFVEFGLEAQTRKDPLSRIVRGVRWRWQRFRRKRTVYLPYASASKVNRAALAWLSQVQEPFFLWIHYMDVHHPYYPPQQYLTKTTGRSISRQRMVDLMHKLKAPKEISAADLQDMIDLYDGCIAYTDDAVSKVINTLSELGFLDKTAVILTSDHGEEFKEHGGTSHKAKLYDELLLVPLVIRIPGYTGMIEINEQVSLLDLSPTLLDLVNLAPSKHFVGQSLKPLLDGKPRDGHNLVFCQCYHEGDQIRFSGQEGRALFAVRTPEWKYIWDEENESEELYNLQSDPGEQTNLAILDPESQAHVWLRQKLWQHIGSLPDYDFEHAAEGEEDQDDALVLERLRGLGYVD